MKFATTLIIAAIGMTTLACGAPPADDSTQASSASRMSESDDPTSPQSGTFPSASHALSNVASWEVEDVGDGSSMAIYGLDAQGVRVNETRLTLRRVEGALDGFSLRAIAPTQEAIELSGDGQVVQNTLEIGGDTLRLLQALMDDTAGASSPDSVRPMNVFGRVGDWFKAHIDCIGAIAGTITSCVGAASGCATAVTGVGGVVCVASGVGCGMSIRSAKNSC